MDSLDFLRDTVPPLAPEPERRVIADEQPSPRPLHELGHSLLGVAPKEEEGNLSVREILLDLTQTPEHKAELSRPGAC